MAGQTGGDLLAKGVLPAVLFAGWAVAAPGEMLLPVWPSILLVLAAACLGALWLIHEARWEGRDLRWLALPVLLLGLGWLDPSWSSPAMYDQADHLQTANRYLGRWTWEPFHMETPHAFRPKIISGLIAIELALNGTQDVAHALPFVLILACGWQAQALAERLRLGPWSLVAAVLVVSMPVMMEFGRTLYLEALATGGLLLVLRLGLELQEGATKGRLLEMGVLASLVGGAKYPYLHLGPALSALAARQGLHRAWPVLIGWMAVQAPFFLADLFQHGSPVASLGPQVEGTVNSVTSEVLGYTPLQALNEALEQLGLALLVVLLLGTLAWGARRPSSNGALLMLLLAPTVVLFVLVLDFGWPRYHLPWLAALVVFGMAGLRPLTTLEGWKQDRVRLAVTALLLLLVVPHLHGVVATGLEERETTLSKIEWREDRLASLVALGDHLPDDAVVLAGLDITLGARYGVPTYRFGPSEDPIHDSILVVEATHVVLGGSGARFEWERDPMMALGAPLSPVADEAHGGGYQTLWEVDQHRLPQHDAASALILEDVLRHVGNAVLLEAGTAFEAPESWAVVEAVAVPANDDGQDVVDLRFGRPTDARQHCAGSLCPSVLLVPDDGRMLVLLGWEDA